MNAPQCHCKILSHLAFSAAIMLVLNDSSDEEIEVGDADLDRVADSIVVSEKTTYKEDKK